MPTKHTTCYAVTGDYNQVVFAGPRVRMGMHYAHAGTIAMRTHNITRQNVYGGPAIKIGSEVSDIAAGGQILLTEVSHFYPYDFLGIGHNATLCTRPSAQ